MQTNPNYILSESFSNIKQFMNSCFSNIQCNIGIQLPMLDNTTVDLVFILFLLNEIEEFHVKMRH